MGAARPVTAGKAQLIRSCSIVVRLRVSRVEFDLRGANDPASVYYEKCVASARKAHVPDVLQFKHRTYDETGSPDVARPCRSDLLGWGSRNDSGVAAGKSPARRRTLRHRLWSITSRQNASAIAKHDQPPRVLRNAASIDRAGDRQVVVLVDDLLLAGAFAALFEQLYRVLAFGFDTMPFPDSAQPVFWGAPPKRPPVFLSQFSVPSRPCDRHSE